MLNFYHELDHLKLSEKEIDELFNFSEQVKTKKLPHTDENGWYNNRGEFVTSFDDFQFFSLDDSHTQQAPLSLKKIKSFLDLSEWKNGLVWLVWVDGKLDWHRDVRNVSVSIPLVDIKEPVYWIDQDLKTIIGEYKYKKGVPVIFNTAIHHGNLQNNSPRTMCQLSFMQTIEEVKEWFTV